MQKDESGQWHLDKRVPITLIITILIQTGTLVWFISKLDSRIIALEMVSITQKERDDRQDRAATDAVSMIRSDLRDLDQKIDRLIERSK